MVKVFGLKGAKELNGKAGEVKAVKGERVVKHLTVDYGLQGAGASGSSRGNRISTMPPPGFQMVPRAHVVCSQKPAAGRPRPPQKALKRENLKLIRKAPKEWAAPYAIPAAAPHARPYRRGRPLTCVASP
eukprot:gene12449-biopygen6468